MTNPTTLGKALPIKYGKARNESYGYVAVSVPVYGSSGVIGDFNRALTTGPTLIVGRKGSAGSIHYSATPCWPIDTVYYAETPPDSTLHYFRYLLEHLRLGQHDKSTAIPSLGRDDYNAIPVTVPPLEEQERVVAYLDEQLSRLDASVAALHRVQANLNRYRASVLSCACEGRLVPTEAELARQECRPFETGTQLLQRILAVRRGNSADPSKYKEPTPASASGLPQLPDGWSWASLGQLTTRVADVDHRMPKSAETNIPYVSTKDFFGEDEIDFDGAKKISAVDFESLCRKVQPSHGDILLSRYGTVGEIRMVKTALPFQASYSIAIVKTLAGVELVRYLATALRSRVLQDQMKRDVRATAQPDLGLAHIRLLAIPLPPLAEQHRIVAEADRRLSLVRVAEAQVSANLARAQRLRQSILQAAFSLPVQTA